MQGYGFDASVGSNENIPVLQVEQARRSLQGDFADGDLMPLHVLANTNIKQISHSLALRRLRARRPK